MACLQGLVLVGLWFTGSRTGLYTVLIMLVAAWSFKLAHRPFIFLSSAVGVSVYAFLWGLPWCVEHLRSILSGSILSGSIPFLNPLENVRTLSVEGSDLVRWQANWLGLSLWERNPFTGIGLGVFLHRSSAIFGFPVVIHCTPLWLLVECGLLGVMVLAGVCWRPLGFVISRWPVRGRDTALILLLVGFGSFSCLHEIFFQRIFWLALGLLVSLPSRPGDRQALSGGENPF
jgi:hypothetical protein